MFQPQLMLCVKLSKKKKSSFWTVLFFFATTMNHSLIRPRWKGLYTATSKPAQWLDQEKLQSTSQSQNLHQKRPWSMFGCLLLVWSTTAFWIPVKPLTLRSMLSKSVRCIKNCNALHLALVNRRDQFFSTVRIVTQPRLQKLNDLGDEVLPHLLYSSDPSPADYHFFKHLNNFLQVKSFHNQQEEENGFQEFVESRSMDFYMTRINRLISH